MVDDGEWEGCKHLSWAYISYQQYYNLISSSEINMEISISNILDQEAFNRGENPFRCESCILWRIQTETTNSAALFVVCLQVNKIYGVLHET